MLPPFRNIAGFPLLPPLQNNTDMLYQAYRPSLEDEDMNESEHKRLADKLRAAIAEGMYPVGSKIPSENELSAPCR